LSAKVPGTVADKKAVEQSSYGYMSILRPVKLSRCGFTLAELLIALAILGLISTFTIPKIISAQQNERNNAVAKEAVSMVAGAYQLYRQSKPVTALTRFQDLTPYFNYVTEDTGGSTVDDAQSLGTVTCNASNRCLRLHNGAVLLYYPTMAFGGTGNTNGVWFNLDPDGKVTDGVNGKSVQIWLYTTGRMTTVGSIDPGSCWDAGCNATAMPNLDPPWFKW
jgi:prepilin-type N-terminal cleavage/methylation domain-containing protein